MEKAFTLTQGEANYWWESTCAVEGEDPVSWTRFTEWFLEKYFPDCLQNQLEVEFLELKQGEKSVAEYEAKFTEMARLVPEYVSTEAQKEKRFQQGLKPKICSGVVALQLKTYTSVVQAALIIESDKKLASKERDDKKRKFEGASTSIISNDCVNKMDLILEGLAKPLSIEVSNQDKVSVSQFCPKCQLEILGHSFSADLISFDLGEINVNLGMDWLSQHKANIDCKRKKIMMFTNGNIRVNYQGQKQEKKFLSILKAKKLLRQGCEAYLAYIVDTEKETPNLDEIPIVREFSDVFPDELAGLPSDRKIEFSIDLVPEAEPIS
ncbi:uncharacterized protein LOC141660407 [Apium graveolens]|uniref:uncharacterized protein LOC141660407 n=1 Tax=Apium graveolens TaxID=4045 RepID=UPI003D792EB3